MNRVIGFAVFLVVILSVLFGIHYFLWLRLVRAPQWPRPWNLLATGALILAALSIPASLLLHRSSSEGLKWLAWPAYVWLGVMFLLFVSLLGTDVIRGVSWLFRRGTGDGALEPERRQWMARWFAGVAGAVATGVGLAALRSALGPVRVNRVEIKMSRLSAKHDGLSVAQLSDVHVGPTIGRAHIEHLVERTNALSPDIIAITGDLVDGSVADLRHAVAPLANLRAKHGVFFVTGNHEYFSGASAWVAELERIGVRVLRNERVTIADGTIILELAGVDDHSAARFGEPGHGEDLDKALAGWSREHPVVLLAHQPRSVLEAAKYEVDLQLSGHTHGGQIWPFGALVRLQQQFLAGLGQHKNTQIYVSCGAGYWGPPMRLGAPSEIAHLILRARA